MIKNIKFIQFLKKNIWPLLLVVLTLLISYQNFDSKKWLSGWDTLHPEFNFNLHFYRSIFGAWREDQGLGALAAHSHMSELPRIVVLYLLSFLLPLNTLRAIYILICLILGPLGIYYFLKKAIFKDNSLVSEMASFLGALVYLFNLGTVQIFYVVFEMFAVQYAFLGWLFLFIHKILYEEKRKNHSLFFLICFLSAPMAYASQLWFAFFGSVILYLLTLLILENQKKDFVKKSIKVLGIIITANAFWLFPNLYFLLSGASKVPTESHINRIFSQEIFLINSSYGNIENTSILKNFLFNWPIYDFQQQTFTNLLNTWSEHLENPFIILIGYLVFVLAIFGIVRAFIKKEKENIAIFSIFLLSLIILLNASFPFNLIFNFFRENISIVKEGLRTPYTKFSILLMFSISVFFGIAIKFVFEKLSSRSAFKKNQLILLTAIISFLLMFYGKPMFQEELISSKLYNQIPQEYFNFYQWADKQNENERFALLPVNNFVGWEYYEWGYQGAGFLWFGMKQPLLVRDFDRWNPGNEKFYEEISHAIYDNNPELLKNVVQKYQVSFIILDESKFEPSNKSKDFLKIKESIKMLEQIGGKEVWAENFLAVYDLRGIQIKNKSIYSPENYLKEKKLLPFDDIFTKQIENVQFYNQGIIIKSSINQNTKNMSLALPPVALGNTYTTTFNARYVGTKLEIKFQASPTLYIGKSNIRLDQLSDLSLDTKIPISNLGVKIGNKEFILKNGDSSKFITTFETRKPISVEFYDYSEVRVSNNSKYISPSQIQRVTFNEVIWNNLIQEKRYTIKDNIESITINIPSEIKNIDLKSTFNCNVINNSNSQKIINQEKLILISENNNALCEGIDLSYLSQRENYLIRFAYENKSGRNIKFYLNSQASTRNDLEELLPEKKKEATYLIKSWDLLSNQGYKLIMENRSLGQKSENELREIQIANLPGKFLKEISIEPANLKNFPENNLQITKQDKFGNFQYSANILAKNESMVVLNQAYERGWVGIAVSNNGIYFLEHINFDGWSNGWIVPKGDYKVFIFFWPQWLSLLGFVLLFYPIKFLLK